jgi:hypothetical protein
LVLARAQEQPFQPVEFAHTEVTKKMPPSWLRPAMKDYEGEHLTPALRVSGSLCVRPWHAALWHAAQHVFRLVALFLVGILR